MLPSRASRLAQRDRPYPARGAGLSREAEVRQRAGAVQVGDEPRHLAVADMKQARSLHPYLVELQAARLPRPLRRLSTKTRSASSS
jgi:hypothetical protein